jgi:hypothetical protein
VPSPLKDFEDKAIGKFLYQFLATGGEKFAKKEG